MGPTTPIAAPGEQAGNSNLPIGTVPQPSIANPGLVTGVTLGELYSDNLTLAAPGKPKQTDFITQIAPFLKYAFSAPRFSGLFDYSLTGYLYRGHSEHNQLSQNLAAQGTLVVLPQHFFLDGTALYGRQIINNELPAGEGTYFLTNNRANVAMGTLSPYWIQDLGNVATMTLRYSHGRVVYNTKGIPAQNDTLLAGIPNVTSNALQFSLVSPKYETWGWNLLYSNQRIEPDFGQGIEFAVAKLGTSLQVSGNTQLLADAGKENKYLPDGTVDKLGASFWDAGFDWSNTLDDFKLLVGHRFYGRSTQLSWIHTAALLTTTVSYVEQPTDINQQLLGQNPGQIITSPVGIPRIPSLTERQIYLMKRAMASATYTMARSTLSVTLYDELRTYFTLNSSQERVANADIAWLFNVGVFTTLTPTFGWQRYQFQDGQISYNTYEQLALVHQFNPDNFGSIKLRHDSSNVEFGEPGAHGYGVNVIFLTWTRLF
ncbi:MAG: TIGR03016 family PEP-CTERM system-associated outer membrane protein [Gammaproteobacteria bacterium]